MSDLTLYEISKFIFLSGASGVIGNLATEGLKKISIFFTKKGQKGKINKLYEILEKDNSKEFEEFLNSLDDDLREGLIEILREIEQKAKKLNINIGEINIKNENVGRDKREINNYGRYSEGDYFENVGGDVVKGDKKVYINLKKN